jgi:hypothetical protein
MILGVKMQGGKILVSAIIGILIGLFLYDWFLVPEIQTKVEIRTETKTDTVYFSYVDTVYVDKIKHKFIKDTIIKDYKPKIQAFSSDFTTLYGNASVTGSVLGEVLNIRLKNDFRIPTVTNTITTEKTVTNTVIRNGLFVGGSINSDINIIPSLWYQSGSWIYQYQYNIYIGHHSVGVGRRLF